MLCELIDVNDNLQVKNNEVFSCVLRPNQVHILNSCPFQ